MPRVPSHLLVDPTTQRDDTEPEYRGPSKSQRKREMSALQELGEKLVALPASRLAQLPLAERLLDAIREAQRIKSHEARRRQLQYVGKLMRDVDAETIAAQLHEWDSGSRDQNDRFHALEQWRDRLLESDDALTVLLEHRPGIDIPHLRNLIRQARREQAHNADAPEGHTPQRKHYRELFQALKQILDEPDPT
ncbi:MAG: ribosome biogenesis factor YjgA [Pigmentiphaga sp.]